MALNMLLGQRKWLKQIIEIKHNGVKNFNWPEANRGSTIGVLKSRFPAFFSSESRHPALFYPRIQIPSDFFYEIFCFIIEIDVI